MRYAILGPVVQCDGERRLPVDGRRQLSLLVFLLLHANRAVSADQLIDVVWSDRPPNGARKRLQMAVVRLRETLQRCRASEAPALQTIPGGYLLDVRPGELDADVFCTRLAAGREALGAGDAARAADMLLAALSLWRGPALAQVAYEEFAQPEIRRLDELRLTALHARIDADLALGRHVALIGELEALVGRHPTRERFAEQLMLSLYRCGRQAEALDAYQRVRTHLAAELGLEPGPALRALQAQILDQAPGLFPRGLPWRDRQAPRRSDTQTPRHPPAPVDDLPRCPTSLVGREPELAVTVAMIRRQRVRLLTLTGTGGIGKTRLALELARTLREDFADGARFVSLAAIGEPELVLAAVVQQLGHTPRSGEPPLQTATRLLRSRHALLVLDNFEHVLLAAGEVGRLLAACPDLVVVTTSREPLRISAEHVHEVAPLALPPAAESAQVDPLERPGAVVLFADRAAAVDPGFRLTAASRHAVGQICIKLDGLPLAIELAAARTTLIGPSELLRRLDDTLSLLNGGPRDAEPRHRTLRATIDWSYDLLDDDERAAFCGLAAFAGGATLPAAEAITGAGLDTIDSLVAKNLVVRRRTPDGDARLLLLETIREYALERLNAHPERDAVRGRHCAYFVAFAEAGAQELWGPGQMRWLRMFDDEGDNLRAAVDWSIAAGEAELGLRLAVAAMEQWGVRCRPGEVSGWIRRTLDAGQVSDGGLRGRALVRLAHALTLDTDAERAAAPALARRALPLLLAAHDVRAVCWCLCVLSYAGTPDEATQAEVAARSLTVARRADDAAALLIALDTNIIAARTFADARGYFEQARALLVGMGDQIIGCQLLHNIGWGALEAGERDYAATAMDDGIALVRRVGNLSQLPFALAARGLLWLLEDDLCHAREAFREALERSRDLALAPPAWEALMGLAVIAARAGDVEHAAMLCAASGAIRGDEPLSRPEQELHDRHVEPLRCDDNARLWAQAWDRGAALDYEQAVAAGLGPRAPRGRGERRDPTAAPTRRRPARPRRRG
jgi:predicted ATPase/DNA-binding SARP family transcriptional activator